MNDVTQNWRTGDNVDFKAVGLGDGTYALSSFSTTDATSPNVPLNNKVLTYDVNNNVSTITTTNPVTLTAKLKTINYDGDCNVTSIIETIV